MRPDRREFLKRSAAALGAVGLGIRPGPLRAGGAGRAPEPLRILILGGTSFIGPHQVEYAKARGHQITLFNRGQTNPHLFPGVEKLRGDRNGDLESLKGRTWDVVLDNSASNYEWVRLSAGLLKDAVDRYIYVSSISAYADMSGAGPSEDDPTFTYESAGVSPDAEQLPYGLQKALCEREAREALPGRTTVIRPGLIVGPRDPTDRFTYWPVRVHRGGEVLAPGSPDGPAQVIDARDLSQWMIRVAEDGTTGTFNATGHSRTFESMLDGIREVTSEPATFTWVDQDFLEEQGVQAWSDMPVWMPQGGEYAGVMRAKIDRAVAAGLDFRPFVETVRDTLEWHFTRPEERRKELRAGISAEREAEVLAAWHARKAG